MEDRVHAVARLNTADAVEPLLDLILRLPEETEEADFTGSLIRAARTADRRRSRPSTALPVWR